VSPPPKLTKIRKEDFKDTPPWFDDLLQPLNDFISAVSGGLNQGLTRSENFASVLRTGIEFTGTGAPVTVKHDLGRRPVSVVLAQLEIVTGAALTAAWSMTWTFSGNGTDILLSFQGLPTGRSYRVSLILE
jgi:hypothetical protein